MTNYLINLKRREDRLDSAKKEFAEQWMFVERVEAFDLLPGWLGCLRSHLWIISRQVFAVNNGEGDDVFAIYEDDVKFLYANTAYVALQAFNELPPDWDMLYLGCSPQESFERYSEHLYKMGKNHTTHAIIWHYRPGGAIDYILSKDWDMKYDLLLSEYIHPKFNCFCTYPLLATQHQTSSDCCKRSDLSTIEHNYKKYIR
jgi:hypothetical protein